MFATVALGLLLAGDHALLRVGDYHQGEVAADGARRSWLALHPGDDQGHGAALHRVQVRIEANHDPLLDAPGQQTGTRVSVEDMAMADLLLNGPRLQPGPITVASQRQPLHPAILGGLQMRIDWKDEHFILDTDCQPRSDDPRWGTCRITLTAGDRHQVLAHANGSRNDAGDWERGELAVPKLLFAGDLDRDGKLDLILDLSDHYDLTQVTLLLSSEAASGQMVGEVATLGTVGC